MLVIPHSPAQSTPSFFEEYGLTSHGHCQVLCAVFDCSIKHRSSKHSIQRAIAIFAIVVCHKGHGPGLKSTI